MSATVSIISITVQALLLNILFSAGTILLAQDTATIPCDSSICYSVSPDTLKGSVNFIVRVTSERPDSCGGKETFDSIMALCEYFDGTSFKKKDSIIFGVDSSAIFPNAYYDSLYRFTIYTFRGDSLNSPFPACTLRVDSEKKNIIKKLFGDEMYDQLFSDLDWPGYSIYGIQVLSVLIGAIILYTRTWRALRFREIFIGWTWSRKNRPKEKKRMRIAREHYPIEKTAWELLHILSKEHLRLIDIRSPYKNRPLFRLAGVVDATLYVPVRIYHLIKRYGLRVSRKYLLYLSKIKLRRPIREFISKMLDKIPDPGPKMIRLTTYPVYDIIARIANPSAYSVKPSYSELENHIDMQVEELRQRSHIEYIWAIAFTAPLIGLFGTIYGLMKAFGKVENIAETQRLAKMLSGGIYVALGTTFNGLIIAIIFMLAYYHYNHKLERIATTLHLETERFLRR